MIFDAGDGGSSVCNHLHLDGFSVDSTWTLTLDKHPS